MPLRRMLRNLQGLGELPRNSQGPGRPWAHLGRRRRPMVARSATGRRRRREAPPRPSVRRCAPTFCKAQLQKQHEATRHGELSTMKVSSLPLCPLSSYGCIIIAIISFRYFSKGRSALRHNFRKLEDKLYISSQIARIIFYFSFRI